MVNSHCDYDTEDENNAEDTSDSAINDEYSNYDETECETNQIQIEGWTYQYVSFLKNMAKNFLTFALLIVSRK